MLGKIPFVSMSDRRLGGIENSSLRYFSATRALEFSTSRMVSPSFSRRVRRLLPAGSIARLQSGGNHIRAEPSVHCEFVENLIVDVLVTNSEHTRFHAGRARKGVYTLHGREPCSGCCIVDFLWMFGIRNNMARDHWSSARIGPDLRKLLSPIRLTPFP